MRFLQASWDTHTHTHSFKFHTCFSGWVSGRWGLAFHQRDVPKLFGSSNLLSSISRAPQCMVQGQHPHQTIAHPGPAASRDAEQEPVFTSTPGGLYGLHHKTWWSAYFLPTTFPHKQSGQRRVYEECRGADQQTPSLYALPQHQLPVPKSFPNRAKTVACHIVLNQP